MSVGKRISPDMLTEELYLMIAMNTNIIPINTVNELPVFDTGKMYRVLSGAEKHNIYTWDKDVGKYVLIGADDRDIRWSDIMEKPALFPPSYHQHYESDIADLDKYTKSEIDNKLTSQSEEVDIKLSSKAKLNHTHFMSEITGLIESLSSKVDAIEGMGLSHNSFTDEFKNKLDSLSETASVSYDDMLKALNAHIDNSAIHLKPSDITAIGLVNSKADKTYVDSNLSSKAPLSTFNGHAENTAIHVTSTDKDNWNNKADLTGAEFTGDVKAPSLALSTLSVPTTPVVGHVWFDGSYLRYRQGTTNRYVAHTSYWSLVSQAIAEAGTSTGSYLWSAQRVNQAIKALETPSMSVSITQPTNGSDIWYKEV